MRSRANKKNSKRPPLRTLSFRCQFQIRRKKKSCRSLEFERENSEKLKNLSLLYCELIHNRLWLQFGSCSVDICF
ncbi:hypothetical protein TNIN_181981 [Trichonephila inaurata madagascariensis]|uniref:Uncharacterized protein n=1 Tax=Trichonephila inaurata madagascariensis TaxID=2747483 RepID=A0A8X6YFE5_9ARAC|nr:hypothetical protein TNIN_181981 [Trichonephila inaurata madagascariensis]